MRLSGIFPYSLARVIGGVAAWRVRRAKGRAHPRPTTAAARCARELALSEPDGSSAVDVEIGR